MEKVNARSGKAWNESLDASDQDYLVWPDQPWLKRGFDPDQFAPDPIDYW